MSRDLSDLSLGIRSKAILLLANCAKVGLDVRIISTYRSIQEQDALYDKGRTVPGIIVTNAKGGSSWHNFGLAFDIGLFIDNKYIGSPSDLLLVPPSQRNHEFAILYTRVGVIGKSLKLQWGGDWMKFKDWGHFYEERLPATPPKA